MSLFRGTRGLVILCVSVLSLPSPAAATSIAFRARDLPDLEPGHDLWQYEYFVGGFDYGANVSFSIYFDWSLFGSLEDPPPSVGADWDVIVLQPDPESSSEGLYDAYALVDSPSAASSFQLWVEWIGAPGTVPGSQPFDVTRFDEFGFGELIEVIESGTTTPVPEASTASLLALALGIVGTWRRAARH